MEDIVKVFSDSNRDNWEGLKYILANNPSTDIDELFEHEGLDRLKYQVLFDVFQGRDNPHAAILEAVDIIIDNLNGGWRSVTQPRNISEEEQTKLIEEVRINISKYLAMQPRVMTRQPYEGMSKLFGETLANRVFDTMEAIWSEFFPALVSKEPREEMVKGFDNPLNIYDNVNGRLINYLLRTTEDLIFWEQNEKKFNIVFNKEDDLASEDSSITVQ